MSKAVSDIEARLDRLVNLYGKLDEIIDTIPIELPKSLRTGVKKALFGNQDMAELIAGIKDRRVPRFILVGRTGVGKSSLINALLGSYLAETSDVAVGTTTAGKFLYKRLGKTLFEVLDTRGLAESTASSAGGNAEAQLKSAMKSFEPDAVLFLNRCKERAHMNVDAAFVRTIVANVGSGVPLIALLTQADEMEPSREKLPKEYAKRKLDNIAAAEEQLLKVLASEQLSPLAVLPVSSYIEWDQDPTLLKPEAWADLTIKFDGRYNINRLLDLLEDNIDIRAGIFLMLASRIDRVARQLGERFAKVFSLVASTVASTPIPFSDIYVLLALQSIMIMIIAYLAGEELSFDSAKKLIVSLGGMGAAGFTLRMVAQQGAKLVNLLFAGAGSAISAGVAGAGTYAMGRAAIAYYFDKMDEEDLRKVAEKARNDFKQRGPNTP